MDLDVVIAKGTQQHKHLRGQHIGITGGDNLLGRRLADACAGEEPSQALSAIEYPLTVQKGMQGEAERVRDGTASHADILSDHVAIVLGGVADIYDDGLSGAHGIDDVKIVHQEILGSYGIQFGLGLGGLSCGALEAIFFP